MKTFESEYTLLLRPYLRIVLASAFIVSIIYYFLCSYNSPYYSFTVSNYALPILFALLVQLTVVLPFTNTFSLPKKQNRFGLNFLLFIMLCLPMVASVAVARILSNKVVTVSDVSEIDPDSNERFFKITDFNIARNRVGENFWTQRNHRKHGKDYLSLHLELAAPVQEKHGTKNNFTYWFCMNYKRNKNDVYLKPGEIEDFRKKSLEKFRLPRTVNDVVFLEKIPQKWVTNKKLEAINDIMYRSSKNNFVILEPFYTSRSEQIIVRCLIFIVAFCINIGVFCSLMWKTTKLKNRSGNANWTTKKS
jgi:hypothetical protein